MLHSRVISLDDTLVSLGERAERSEAASVAEVVSSRAIHTAVF